MKLLYAGVDTLDFAVVGALAERDLKRLQTAKDAAVAWQAPALTEIGPARVPVQVLEHGRRGGYAYVLHTGSLGANYAFKENSDARQWNGFASIRASTLAAYGLVKARELIQSELKGMGCEIGGISVARLDYAMDFLAPDFVLDPARFVAHPHARIRPHWSEQQTTDDYHPSAVFRGRHVESVTIGKMPGRQVIVYDKRRAAMQKSDHFWFKIWDLDPKDAHVRVWRVEIRAGKRELKDRWQARTFDEIDQIRGDVVREILASTRYLASEQTDSNVTRQALDPLWKAAMKSAADDLAASTNGILPSCIKEIERLHAQDIYRKQIIGNVAGFAVTMGLADADLEYDLPGAIGRLLDSGLRSPRSSLRKGISRARERLHFKTAQGANGE